MSVSKSLCLCRICDKASGIYTCPRCNIKYCSSQCFKHSSHLKCSENFYREWVMTSLQNCNVKSSTRKKMVETLKKSFEEESNREDAEDLPIEERFADLDLSSDIDEKVIWERLTEAEQNEFKTLLEGETEKLILTNRPWWIGDKVNIVLETFDDSNDCKKSCPNDVITRPAIPVEIKKLCLLTSVQPSEYVKYNLVNILYSYAFIVRFYNCEYRDFLEDVIEAIFHISPVLSEGKTYMSLEETIQDSIRLTMNSQYWDVSLEFSKSLCHDICLIINGPKNASAISYILSALSDINMLMIEFRRSPKVESRLTATLYKSTKKKALIAIKKLQYFISWSVECKDKLKGIGTEIGLLVLPDAVESVCAENTIRNSGNIDVANCSRKALIEELN